MIDFDVETTGVQWFHHKMFLAQFYDGETSVVLEHPKQRDEIQAWLDKDDDFRAWNSAFDWHMMREAGYKMFPVERLHDGMLVAVIMDNQSSAALKARAAKLLGEQVRDFEKEVKSWLENERKRRQKESKDTGVEYEPPNYSDVPDELMHPYALEDVLLTRQVCDIYEPVMRQTPVLQKVYDLELKVLQAKIAMEQRGFPINPDEVRQFELELTERLEELEQRCKDLAGIETFNPNSSKQVYEALERRGADLSKVVNKSMDKKNRAKVDDELAYAVTDFKAEYSMLSKFTRPLFKRTMNSFLKSYDEPAIRPNGRIHANFRQVGAAATGRFSCADPNLQQIPKKDLRPRYCVQASKGKVLVDVDLANIEPRIFAAYAGPGALLDTLQAGNDIYSLLAESTGLRDRNTRNGVVTARDQAKLLFMAILYGAGPGRIQDELVVSKAEARGIRERLFENFPEIKGLSNRVQYHLHDQGYVQSIYGRRYKVGDVNKFAYRGVAYLVQGTAADVLKIALVRLHEKGIPIVAAVHDEFLAEVDIAAGEETAKIMVETMTDFPEITKLVPLEAEAVVVDRWSQSKDKDFVPNFAKEGVLL